MGLAPEIGLMIGVHVWGGVVRVLEYSDVGYSTYLCLVDQDVQYCTYGITQGSGDYWYVHVLYIGIGALAR